MSSTMEDRIRRLAATVAALRKGKSFSITKLTMIKALCQKPEDARAFVLHVARLAREQLDGKHGHRVSQAESEKFKKPVVHAMVAMEKHRKRPPSTDVDDLRACLDNLCSLQDQHRNVAWGTLRIIESMPALLIEKAVRCLLFPDEGPRLAYDVARDYCERYDPRYFTGLIPASAPRLEEVVEFLARYHLRRPLHAVLASKPSRQQTRPERRPAPRPVLEPHSLAATYPALATWVKDGWVEIGRADWTRSFVRALDEGGQVWEGISEYPSLEAALDDLNRGIEGWRRKIN